MAGDEPDPERGSQPPEKAPVAASSTVGENTVTTVDKVILLSFRGLQLRRIEELQDSLLKLASDAEKERPLIEPTRVAIDKALADYATALRIYETLSLNSLPSIPYGSRLIGKLAKQREETPDADQGPKTFLGQPLIWVPDAPKTSAPLVKAAIQAADTSRTRSPSPGETNRASILSPGEASHARNPSPGHASHARSLSDEEAVKLTEKITGDLGFRELDQQGRLKRVQKEATVKRIAMAMEGGVALISPVLIMVLHPTRNTYLVTVSVATSLMALIIGLFATDSTEKDVLAGTAAYAAVLVVFIGAINPTIAPAPAPAP